MGHRLVAQPPPDWLHVCQRLARRQIICISVVVVEPRSSAGTVAIAASALVATAGQRIGAGLVESLPLGV